MIKSMTGYGRSVQVLNGREYTVEIRAVNNRYLDCTVKMPRQLSFAEDAVKKAVRDAVARGKVEVGVSLNALSGAQAKISLNRSVVEEYLAAMKTLADDYCVANDISVSAITRLPDVFVVEKAETDEAQEQADLLCVTAQALDAFNAMRETEGMALADDILGRGKTIAALVDKVEQRSEVTLAEYRVRLAGKMKEVLATTDIDESRILTEAAIFADRIAVDEETVRLRSHLSQMDGMFAGGGSIGRKLDFLLQEMNRETNTIGSKGNDVEQARTVVEMKAELEKIREQIQNIE
ncbi:MAG: YicC family protein [Oscillospiraceae bacterium]|nr:YicC family protein [Oscillospiraceae bacterium]